MTDSTPSSEDADDLPEISVRRAEPAWGVLLILLGVWSVFFNVLGHFTWGWGPLSFAMLLGAFFLAAYADRIAPLLAKGVEKKFQIRRGAVESLALVIIILYIALDMLAFIQEMKIERNQTFLIDIAANTYEAGRWFFGEGLNPYTHFSQVWDPLTPDIPNVTVEGDETFLYGVPYFYGFPYFPMMFISFEPFRRVVESYNAVRVGNLVFYLANLGLIAGLCRSIAPAGYRRATALLAVLAFLSARIWANEIFHLGVVDIVISMYGLAGLLMVSRRKPVLCGICFGLAFGCKLLPAPMWAVLVAWWWFRDGGLKPSLMFLAAFCIMSGALLVPFLAWHPGAFVSSTILYFLTSQGAGDDTSLWYVLPDVLKPLLLIAGGLWIAGLFIRFFLRRHLAMEDAIRYAFLTYVIFIAFNKQTHLNHLWSIYAMGCVGLTLTAVGALLGASKTDSTGISPPQTAVSGSESSDPPE